MKRLKSQIKTLIHGKYYNNKGLFPRISSDETYLMSFPRSGNTWMRHLITCLIHDREDYGDFVKITVPDIHRYREDGEKKPTTKPLIVKSHVPFVDIPAKVIYLVRDGREAMLSYFYLKVKEGEISPDASPVDFYFKEDIWPCPWHVHIAGWLDGLARWSPERYKIIRYEDLVKSPAEHLFAVAEFIGIPVTQQSVQRAIELNKKTRLKHIESRDHKGRLNSVVGLDKQVKWQDILLDEDLARYEALAGAELKRLGYPTKTIP
ncbi:sulfotransferase domain-containing protein [Chroococcidiopsis sp. TS-821]|uniref:sulfotransferase domain-containing protein n=1 Tax=Chroococcidiopsis sp. TS-821 TaxID=1378066 RepID=UPI000CEEC5A0|nr:sulfotransferase domain-containing protein [Chroococcidiopsis sp. TS-821]PPS40648.1 hypothetical protein B1A85_19410 [Chroococcidiopsis sp. TS-821]